MKAADLNTHPDFRLMRQSDIVSFYHLQMPRWLFGESRYKHLSLEAKVAYTFLLNRFQLSRLNGWINSDGEVFIIFTREELADEMQVSYRKAIAVFKELAACNLIWERRCGRGEANQIYLAAVELSDHEGSSQGSAPFLPSPGEEEARAAKMAGPEADKGGSRYGGMAGDGLPASNQELQKRQVMTCQNGNSTPAVPAGQELPTPHPSNTYHSYIDNSQKEISQSIHPSAEAEKLQEIIDRCDLWALPSDEAGVMRNAIERLFYSQSFRIGGAVLPQPVVRDQLRQLDYCRVEYACERLKSNQGREIRNSTAYAMAVLYNSVWGQQSDLMVDPTLNAMRASPQIREGENPC